MILLPRNRGIYHAQYYYYDIYAINTTPNVGNDLVVTYYTQISRVGQSMAIFNAHKGYHHTNFYIP